MSLEIEKLVVKIEADIAEFKRNLKEAGDTLKNQSSGMRGALGSLNAGFDSAIEQVVKFRGAISVVAGAAVLGEFIKKSLDAGDEVSKLATITGLSAESFQSLSFAASQANVDQSEFTAAMRVFNRTVGDAVSGNEQAVKAFNSLNVSIYDSAGNLRENETLFKEVSDKIKNLGGTAYDASVAQDLFGKSSSTLIGFLRTGSDEIQRQQKVAKDLGIVLDEKLVRAADETNDKLRVLGQILSVNVNKAILEMAPTIAKASDAILGFIVGVGKSIEIIGKFGKGLSDVFTDAPAIKIQNLNETLRVKKERLEALERPAKSTFEKFNKAVVEAFTPTEKLKEEIKQVESQLRALEVTQDRQTESVKRKTISDKAAAEARAYRARVEKEADEIMSKFEKGSNKEEQLQHEIEVLGDAMSLKKSMHDEYNAAIVEKEIQLQQFKDERAAKEVDFLIAQNSNLIAVNDYHNQAIIDSNKKRIDQVIADENLSVGTRLSIDAKAKAEEKKREEQRKRDIKESMDWISSLQHSKSKEMAAVGKAAAVVNTTIATYEAAQKAYLVGMSAGFPVGMVLGPALAAAAVAAGLSRVAAISGADIGFASGADLIPGAGIRDSVPAMLMPGERVVKTDTNRVLEQFLMDYRDNGDASPMGARIEIALRDDLVEFIEAKIIERGRLAVSLTAA